MMHNIQTKTRTTTTTTTAVRAFLFLMLPAGTAETRNDDRVTTDSLPLEHSHSLTLSLSRALYFSLYHSLSISLSLCHTLYVHNTTQIIPLPHHQPRRRREQGFNKNIILYLYKYIIVRTYRCVYYIIHIFIKQIFTLLKSKIDWHLNKI